MRTMSRRFVFFSSDDRRPDAIGERDSIPARPTPPRRKFSLLGVHQREQLATGHQITWNVADPTG